MANNIELFSGFSGLLDQAYAQASLTSVLDGQDAAKISAARVNELIVPTFTLSGLADYVRDTGYAAGTVSLTNQTIQCNYDRGRMFQVDVLDDEETAGIAFGRLAGEFIRGYVVPELDAFRFSEYAQQAGTKVTGKLTTGAAVLAAIRAANNALDDSQAPMTERHLFITSALLGLVEDLDTTTSRAALDRYTSVTRVNPGRFYSSIDLLDGSTSGEEEGGFEASDDAEPLNFLAVQKDAVIQYTRHVQPKVIRPEENQQADAWKFAYRVVSLAKVYPSRVMGLYAHVAE